MPILGTGRCQAAPWSHSSISLQGSYPIRHAHDSLPDITRALVFGIRNLVEPTLQPCARRRTTCLTTTFAICSARIPSTPHCNPQPSYLMRLEIGRQTKAVRVLPRHTKVDQGPLPGSGPEINSLRISARLRQQEIQTRLTRPWTPLQNPPAWYFMANFLNL